MTPRLSSTLPQQTNLLEDLYGEIVIPTAVAEELGRNGMRTLALRARVVAARNRDAVEQLREQLDPCEAEAVVVAGEWFEDLMLVG